LPAIFAADGEEARGLRRRGFPMALVGDLRLRTGDFRKSSGSGPVVPWCKVEISWDERKWPFLF